MNHLVKAARLREAEKRLRQRRRSHDLRMEEIQLRRANGDAELQEDNVDYFEDEEAAEVAHFEDQIFGRDQEQDPRDPPQVRNEIPARNSSSASGRLATAAPAESQRSTRSSSRVIRRVADPKFQLPSVPEDGNSSEEDPIEPPADEDEIDDFNDDGELSEGNEFEENPRSKRIDPKYNAKIRREIPIKYASFDIIKIGKQIVGQDLPADDNVSLYEGSPHTKGEFARDLLKFMRVNRMAETSQSELVEGVFVKHFVSEKFCLPTRVTRQQHIRSDIGAYDLEYDRNLWCDVCPKSCCVFVEEKVRRTIFLKVYRFHNPLILFACSFSQVNLNRCPSCKTERFTRCSAKECKENTDYDQCRCHYSKRTPLKRINYRPIIPLLRKLIAKPRFCDALNYKFVKPQKNRTIYDISDGKHARKHLLEMQRLFEEKFPDGRYQDHEVHPLCLLFSQFYDGAKVFKRTNASFWPLFISILNLPPTYRNRLGVGMFLASLFTAKAGSVAEYFLFMRCFIEELKLLSEGIHMRDGYGRQVFIQVRLIQHLCDGRAQEKIFKCQGAGCMFGCTICNGVCGTSRPALNKVIYVGHRVFLSHKHFLRSRGQTQDCCQLGGYDGRHGADDIEKLRRRRGGRYATAEEEGLVTAGAATVADVNSSSSSARSRSASTPRSGGARGQSDATAGAAMVADVNSSSSSARSRSKSSRSESKESGRFIYCRLVSSQWFSQSCETHIGENAEEMKTINNFVLNKKEAYEWHHGDVVYDFNIFENHAYYLSCDYRRQRTYQRVSHDSYMSAGLLAEKSGVTQNGIHGVCLYCDLSYSDVSKDFTNDYFHILELICKNCMQNWVGERVKAGSKIANWCVESVEAHPSLLCAVGDDDEGKIPWQFSKICRERIEDAVNCILVPYGHGSDISVRNMFSNKGYIRGTQIIHLFSSLMPLILTIAKDYELAYKAFFLMLSRDVIELLSPEMSLEELKSGTLHKKILETVSLHEGLFPESESLFSWHQLIELASHIRLMGLLKNMSCLGGERAMPALKRHVPQGGMSYEVSVTKLYSLEEDARLEAAYDFDLDSMHSTANLLDQHKDLRNQMHDQRYMSYNSETGRMEFTEHRVGIYHKGKRTFKLSDYEFFSLCAMLGRHSEEYVCDGSRDRAAAESCLYRVVIAYKAHVRAFRNDAYQCFSTFITDFVRDVIENAQQHEQLNEDFKAICESHYVAEDCALDRMEDLSQRVRDGVFWADDLLHIYEFRQRCNGLTEYCKANIYSTTFRSRGIGCRETKAPIHAGFSEGSVAQRREYLKPHSPSNELRNRYNARDDYSSWCRFRDKRGEQSKDDQFAQFNGFFAIDLPADGTLHRLCIGSITQRQHINVNVIRKLDYRRPTQVGRKTIIEYAPTPNDPGYVSYIPIEDKYSLRKKLFVPLVQVYSTPILVIPFLCPQLNCEMRDDEDKIPAGAVLHPIQLNRVKEEGFRTIRYAKCRARDASMLMMIEMYPQRAVVKYQPESSEYYRFR